MLSTQCTLAEAEQQMSRRALGEARREDKEDLQWHKAEREGREWQEQPQQAYLQPHQTGKVLQTTVLITDTDETHF